MISTVPTNSAARRSAKHFNQRWARRHRKQARKSAARVQAMRSEASQFMRTNRELFAQVDNVDYDAPRPDPWANFSAGRRASMERAQARRRARLLREGPTRSERPARTARVVLPVMRIRGCSLGRHEARPGRGAAERSRVARSSGGGSSSGDDGGGGGSDPPGESDGGDGERFSDEEARQVAAHVAELFPDHGLTVGRFRAAVWPFLFGLTAADEADAIGRIYGELPDRLRLALIGDALTWRAARIAAGEVSLEGARPCRICGEDLGPDPGPPLQVVADDGICLDCWDLPYPLRSPQDVLRLGPGTVVLRPAADCTTIDRRSPNDANGGAS